MRVGVVTDSSACLPGSPSSDPLLRVLPITIHLPTEDLSDGATGAAVRVYGALERGDAVKSSSPSVLAYLSAIEDMGTDGVVVVTPASEFTVMHTTARLAAQIASVRVAVVDSRTAAAAHGLVVEAAYGAALGGDSLENVERSAHEASRRAELVATIDSLEVIRRSGRIPSGTIDSAQSLGIRPVFRLRAGVLERLAIPRSTHGAYRRIKKEWLAGGGQTATRTTVFHAARREAAAQLGALLSGPTSVAEFSPAMGIHTGPGVVGVAWLRR